MRTQEELQWIEMAAAEFKEILTSLGLTIPELAGMLEVSARDLQRIRTGADTNDPRIVPTEVYAKLFYHCGMVSADPRFIPGLQAGVPRAWAHRQSMRWVVEQGKPIFLTQADMAGSVLKDLINLCLELIAEDPDEAEKLAVKYELQWREIRDIARLMLLDSDQRLREISIRNQFRISTEE